MTLPTNYVLRDTLLNIIKTPKSTSFNIDISIHSESDTSYAFTPLYIDTVQISQDFYDAYMDSILVKIPISPAQYADMYDHRTDLFATLTWTHIAPNSIIPILDPPPTTKTYRVSLINPKDIRQQLKDTKYRLEPDRSIDIRLMDSVSYNMRHIRMEGIMGTPNKPQSVSDVIAMISKCMGASGLYLVPPDNIHRYRQIILPTGAGIEEIFDRLQKGYGVYTKGINYYYHDSMMYIYPPYETNPKFPQKMNVYLGDVGEFAGSPSRHRWLDEEQRVFEIVADGNAKVINLSNMAAENHGTGVYVTRASHLRDNFAKTDSADTTISNMSTLTANVEGLNTTVKGRKNIAYGGQTDNIFEAASEIAKYQAVMLTCIWPTAIPYILKPGHAIRYVYDKGGITEYVNGILDGIMYSYSRQSVISGSGSKPIYIGNAALRLRLEPTDTIDTTE